MMNKIYCFINGGNPYFLDVLALADDGHVLAGHASSSEHWAMHDIGINSDWKHDIYSKHFPNGYELIWLDKPMENEGFRKAAELNEKLGQEVENK